VLVRCNGPHGTYNRGSGDANHPHWDFHIHVATEKALAADGKAEKYAEKTGAYASFEEAIQYFLKAVNLNQKEAEKHFPLRNQTQFLFKA
jgi:fructose-1,6-bisphosphatase